MMYIATVYAYDVMENVQLKGSVRAYPDSPDEVSSTIFECTTTIPGIGESDPRQWLEDALVGLLEAL